MHKSKTSMKKLLFLPGLIAPLSLALIFSAPLEAAVNTPDSPTGVTKPCLTKFNKKIID